MRDLDDEELKLVIKSLSITYDATSKKLERLRGRYYDEAVTEAGVCDRVLTKAKTEQSRRWRHDRTDQTLHDHLDGGREANTG